MINKNSNTLKLYSFDLWILYPNKFGYPVGSFSIEFNSVPTVLDICNYIEENYTLYFPFIKDPNHISIHNQSHTNKQCIKCYDSRDGSTYWYTVFNIHAI